MPVSNPILFILNHKSSILPIHYDNGQKAKLTWNRLKDSLPELQQVMKFNTFKQYLSVITAVTNELDNATKEVRQNLSNFTVQLDEELDKVRQGLDNQPQRILGWNVRKAKDGYYRCYRKINNQVHSLYLGKTIDVQKAQHRIQEKEKNVKLDKS